jgi:quercetin dioxygenase-like cupin family protein
MAVAVAAMACLSAAAPSTSGFATVTPADVQWHADPADHGAAFAVVLGDPSKPGLYVIRGRFPPHVMDSPHSHDQDRYVTVLQGIWYAGTGPVFDPAKATPLPPGSIMKHPAGGVHWDGSAGDETVIVQIIGMGPVKTIQADPKAPQWRDVQLPAK